ncbi:unnamed protein product [Cyprideis torosa]|uniref:Uncharacterized protein n=1 Tax=Cyprideis torosa TaxID=163714 RepID=A0A7R8W3U1_9CRUS|nr:unnamed protein product [Cyprideis torosa]CAG0883255.1 unnamed protein product [Cyprideis torosa]
MGKHEVGTPKWIANRIKAKGLQKLRWYCQMCQKQCRDENGFKCHTMSEGHQRQLLLFGEHSHQYMGEFSRDFESGYLTLLSRQYGTKRVNANQVYQEYIHDRHHVHMNSTHWTTLTDFVKHLGRTGKCIVDETEKGWFVTYIDRDPEAIAAQEALRKKERMARDDETRQRDFIAKQVERGAASSSAESESSAKYTELQRPDETPLTLGLKLAPTTPTAVVASAVAVKKNALELLAGKKRSATEDNGNDRKKEKKETGGQASAAARASALAEIMKEEEKRKEQNNRKDYWITEGIVVKIITKSLGEKFYKAKAVVKEVHDKYTAIVEVIDLGKKVKLDQAHLETVIPAVGRKVLVVNGAYRGTEAELQKINVETFSVDLEISSGPTKGRQLKKVPYEDVSKLYVPS